MWGAALEAADRSGSNRVRMHFKQLERAHKIAFIANKSEQRLKAMSQLFDLTTSKPVAEL